MPTDLHDLLPLLAQGMLALHLGLLCYADAAGRRVVRRFIEEVSGPPLFAANLAAEAGRMRHGGFFRRMRWLRHMRNGMSPGMRPAARRALRAYFGAKCALLLACASYLAAITPSLLPTP